MCSYEEVVQHSQFSRQIPNTSLQWYSIHVILGSTMQIDLGLADVPMVILQMKNAFGFDDDETIKVCFNFHVVKIIS